MKGLAVRKLPKAELTSAEYLKATAAIERRKAQRKSGARVDGATGNENAIKLFLHCAKCLADLAGPHVGSPRDYARLSVGWTPLGLQVWCNRHEANVLHVDFEGYVHPGDTTCKADQ